jgi:hypothetical protein
VAQRSILSRLLLKISSALWQHVLNYIQMCLKKFLNYVWSSGLLKNSNLRARRTRHFFFKITLGIFFYFYYYESKKVSGDQIREMVATGFGRFHKESPLCESLKRNTNKVETWRIPPECVHKPGVGGGYASVTFSVSLL